MYRGAPAGIHRIDIVVDNQAILELKSVRRLLDVHFAQIRSYLRASGPEGRPRVQIQRACSGGKTDSPMNESAPATPAT
ncbi:MAG: GxxExxY protein [Gemmatimonadales bacterium]